MEIDVRVLGPVFKHWAVLDYMLVTPLAPDEVKRRLEANTEPGYDNALICNKFFEGRFTVNTFTINTVVGTGEDADPSILIKGTILEHGDGSKIELKTESDRQWFTFFWLAGPAFLFLIGVGAFFRNLWDNDLNGGEWVMMLGSVVMFCFGYFTTSIPFRADSRWVKDFLMRLLEAREYAPVGSE